MASESKSIRNPLIAADAPHDATWEASIYPTADAATQAWLREQREMIRAFLASGIGTYGSDAKRAPLQCQNRTTKGQSA